jgi:hypothetical protein
MQSPMIRYTCAFCLSSQLVYRLTQPMQIQADDEVSCITGADVDHTGAPTVYQQRPPGPGLAQFLAVKGFSPTKRGRIATPPQFDETCLSCSPDLSSEDNVEANDVVHLVQPPLDYYRQFTNSVRMCDHHAIPLFGPCYVNIQDEEVEAVVGATTVEGENQWKDRRFILCYILYDRHGSLLGFFSSGRVTRRESGWTADDVTVPIYAPGIPVTRYESNDVPLCVVFTGTFPELGGGSGLALGKAALKTRVDEVPNARVVAAISGKTTHLVVGQDPGQQKVLAASRQPLVQQMALQPFLEMLSARLAYLAFYSTFAPNPKRVAVPKQVYRQHAINLNVYL